MDKKIFEEFFTQKSYKVLGTMAFGMENGYPVSVQMFNNSLWKVTLSTGTEEGKKLAKEMNKEAGDKMNFSYNNGYLCYDVKVKAETYQEAFRQAAAAVTGILQRKGLKTSDTCPFCKQKGCDYVAAVGSGYSPVHRRCVEQKVAQANEKAEKNDLGGNYFTGLIGAVLGAIIGVIPSVLSIVLADKIYSILFAIIPLCIYQGYKLLRGKMNKAVIVFTVVLSVLSVYLLEIILITYYGMADYGIPFSYAILLVADLLTDPQMWVDMTTDSIVSFIFVALGIWYTWGKISRTSQTEMEEAKDVLGTLIPLEMVDMRPDDGYNETNRL